MTPQLYKQHKCNKIYEDCIEFKTQNKLVLQKKKRKENADLYKPV